eukprot:CAMPEP_0115340626 /NCGR_PEP_ID=MMETSP0270-20121206/91244_1 /TAXON_ID=71861 /ORGANISM="Scrippsiella trochoidea, Strain CCMP3099" /LENGTH=158 /DNA_ID=CAMNT_0002762087 /DNA_START=561 /DNA_END=1033 /DNA_ORIENTATION=-
MSVWVQTPASGARSSQSSRRRGPKCPKLAASSTPGASPLGCVVPRCHRCTYGSLSIPMPTPGCLMVTFSLAMPPWPSSDNGNSPEKPPATSLANRRALPRSSSSLPKSLSMTVNSRTSSGSKPGNTNLWFQIGFKSSVMVRVLNLKRGLSTTSQMQYG